MFISIENRDMGVKETPFKIFSDPTINYPPPSLLMGTGVDPEQLCL